MRWMPAVCAVLAACSSPAEAPGAAARAETAREGVHHLALTDEDYTLEEYPFVLPEGWKFRGDARVAFAPDGTRSVQFDSPEPLAAEGESTILFDLRKEG